MERDIRHLRGAMIQATTRAEKNKFKKLIEAAEAKYKEFSLSKEMAYYMRRTEIF